MNLWEKINKFTRPYSDDEYDENYEDDSSDYEEAEEEAAPRSRRTSPFDTDAQTESDTYQSSAATSGPTGFSGHVVNSGSPKYEVVLFHAKNFGDAAKAADELRAKKAVILNMENVDKALTRRVVDFLSGCVYALDGKANKVAQSTYFFCTHNMNVSGNLESVPNESESYF